LRPILLNKSGKNPYAIVQTYMCQQTIQESHPVRPVGKLKFMIPAVGYDEFIDENMFFLLTGEGIFVYI